MTLDKINFVPVLNGSVLNCALRDDHFINGKRATFYTTDGLFSHPTFLINPFHHDKLFDNIRAKGLIPKNATVLADSGGLQEITLNKLKSDPVDVFKWQQKHTNIGFSVDSIPYITPKDGTNRPGSFSGWHFDSANFDKYAKQSKANIDATKPHKDPDSKFKFFGIIQGINYETYLRWYNIIKDNSYLDGYCCKAPNNNPITLEETCIFAMNNINKPLHFLGIGNLSRSIVLYYANKHLKQTITFDSSSYDVGTQYRSYLLPFMMNRKLRFVSNHNLTEHSKEICNECDVVHIENATDICDCIACRSMGDKLGEMIRTNNPMLGSLISLHNLMMNIKWTNYVKSIIHKQDKLKEFVKFNFEESLSKKILTAFELIDIAADKGHEYAFDKFKNDMQRQKSISRQKTIFM